MDYGNIAAAFSFAYAFGYLIGGRAMDRFGVKRGCRFRSGVERGGHGAWARGAHRSRRQVPHELSVVLVDGKRFCVDDAGDADDGGGIHVRPHRTGFDGGANFPGAIKATAEWFPVKERALATGWFNAGSNVGAIIICPVGVPWMFAHVGWAATFYITGAIGFIWVAVVVVDLRNAGAAAATFQRTRLHQRRPTTDGGTSGCRAVAQAVAVSRGVGLHCFEHAGQGRRGLYQFFLPDF